jgi:hypothetical protein
MVMTNLHVNRGAVKHTSSSVRKHFRSSSNPHIKLIANSPELRYTKVAASIAGNDAGRVYHQSLPVREIEALSC